jgi:hypothetical protein
MTDKELLELAAKAFGITGIVMSNDYGVYWNEFPDYPGETFNLCWNPLEDDGQALRLAVKLKIDYLYEMNMPYQKDILKLFETEPYIATRRAIVLAAAEIGKSL